MEVFTINQVQAKLKVIEREARTKSLKARNRETDMTTTDIDTKFISIYDRCMDKPLPMTFTISLIGHPSLISEIFMPKKPVKNDKGS